MANVPRQIVQQTPGTDTGGTVFRMLTVAGLIGLAILHPEYVSLVFDNAVRLISVVIRGEPGGTQSGTAPQK